MRKFFSLLLIVLTAMVLSINAHAWSEAKYVSMGIADTLATGTSADTIYSAAYNIAQWDYIGAMVYLDVTSGGGAGAGVIAFQGRIKRTGDWEIMPMITLADSLSIVHSIAVSSTADLTKNVILSVVPINLDNIDDADTWGVNLVCFHVGNIWPYDEIRLRIVDTNWNAAVDVSGYWALKRK